MLIFSWSLTLLIIRFSICPSLLVSFVISSKYIALCCNKPIISPIFLFAAYFSHFEGNIIHTLILYINFIFRFMNITFIYTKPFGSTVESLISLKKLQTILVVLFFYNLKYLTFISVINRRIS